MTLVKLLLNFPWTLLGLLCGMLSLPTKITVSKNPQALIVYTRSFWWLERLPGQKGVRAIAHGNTVVLGSKLLEHDLEHELIHVEQCMRKPFIHPLLYAIEASRHDVKHNRYEVEAYTRAGNAYLG